MSRFFSIARVTLGLVLLATQVATAQRGSSPFPRARSDTSRSRALGTIDGFVSDTSLNPLQAAFVSILGTSIRVGTGPNGRFRIVKVPSGQYLVIVKRVGYAPTSAVVDVPASDTLRLSYTLEKAAANILEPVVVTAQARSVRMKEFAERKRLGFGEFMDADEIERRSSVFATELFRKFPSIAVSPSRTSAMTEYFALSAREGGNPAVGACPMQVYLDRVPLPTPFNLDLLPPPRDLAGIEVYSGASTVPPQFAGFNRGCGVILVWTRDGY